MLSHQKSQTKNNEIINKKIILKASNRKKRTAVTKRKKEECEPISLPESEPIFNKRGMLSGDFLEDWLFFLAEKNDAQVASDQLFRDHLTPQRVIEIIFGICKELQQPPEVIYISIELFDRFLVNHLEDVHNEITERNSRTLQNIDYYDVDKRLKNQVLLRLLSCIQLSSKLHSHSKAITVSEAQVVLVSFQCKFTNEQILMSELRVYKTLRYKIDLLSPLAYAESLLEILNFNLPNFQPESIYSHSVILLDFYYLFRDIFYNAIFQKTVGAESINLSPTDSALFRSIKSDYMLLSSAILVTAGHLESDHLGKTLLSALSKITYVSSKDIQTLSDLLFQLIND